MIELLSETVGCLGASAISKYYTGHCASIERGVIVGFEEGPIGAPYVRWLDGFHVSLEERCMVRVVNEKR